MPLKRTYQVPSKYTAGVAKRPKMMLPPVSRRPLVPEVKEINVLVTVPQVVNGGFFNTNITGAINQGTAGSDRVGNRIKLLSVEVTGRACGTTGDMTMLLVVPKNSFSIVSGNFTATVGPVFDADVGWTIGAWTRDPEKHTILQTGEMIRKFSSGMDVQWDAASPVKNHIFFVLKNNTGANVDNTSCNVRLRFVDS